MRPILTNPPDRVFPTQDNVEGNLVVAKGDFIVKAGNVRYMVIELLGTGTFGQVFRCVSEHGDEVAIKVVKSSNKYYQSSMNEVRLLKRFKDAGFCDRFVELYDAFIYQQHLCIVMELLGINMYELSRITRFRGFDYSVTKTILRQVLEGLCELHSNGITHSDLKPENILVSDIYRFKTKLIDFGSSSTRVMSNVFYAQSRFYRAPEVILGIPYGNLIDIWSFGCVAYELLMGHPLFPGRDNFDQIHLINEFYDGGIPGFMIEHGKNSKEFFGPDAERRNSAPISHSVVRSRIYERHGNSSEINLFIDMLMLALQPSYLERILALSLLNHPYFSNHSDRRSTCAEIPRASSPGPATPPLLRKHSMFDYGEEKETKFGMRKRSVYDPDAENRFNKD